MEYSDKVHKLGITLFKLLSVALGLKPDHLIELDCAKGHVILSHYYPPCPEPKLTMGTTIHSDPDFLTILLQDQIGGLQVLFRNRWLNVPPLPGALVVNIGDLLQASPLCSFWSSYNISLLNMVFLIWSISASILFFQFVLASFKHFLLAAVKK